MGHPTSEERDSSIIGSLSEAAMHMYTAAIDALPFAEDDKFHERAEVVLSGMRKLRAALSEAASSSRPSPAVIVALSNVRRRYDALMSHAAAAPGSSLGQQLYVTRVRAKLSAQELANGAGLSAERLDELEAGATPTDDEAAKVKDAIEVLGGLPSTDFDDPYEPVEARVNGWDDSLVSDNAG
jgi:hypothetical protein